MARASSPTLRRRELAARLRELRLRSDLTVEQVANHLMVSSAKISRLETASRGASTRDVRDLAKLYGLDETERDRLMALARESREPTLWQSYDFPATARLFVDLEASASAINDYQSAIVPVLLQTDEYARTLIRGIVPDAPDEVVAQRLQARMVRRRLLDADRPPRLHAVLDEAVLHRQVGGPEAMRVQLEYVRSRAELPHVTVQIIPFAVGAHPGMSSTFVLLELQDHHISDVVYVEGLVGELFIERPADVERYRRVFQDLKRSALEPDETDNVLKDVIHRLYT